MSEDADHVRTELRTFKAEVNTKLDTVSSEIKELTRALRELIRLDGDIRRQNDALARIGRQVDDHEVRLRRVEIEDSKQGARIGYSERWIWMAATGVSSGVVGVVVYMVTNGALA